MQDPIEKLRGRLLCSAISGLNNFEYVDGDAIADEIEAAYMKLPVDADGVPIRPGDTVKYSKFGVCDYTVRAVTKDFWVATDDFAYNPDFTRHVNPDTVEGIIAEAMSYACEPESPYSVNSKYVREYAERIWKAVGK